MFFFLSKLLSCLARVETWALLLFVFAYFQKDGKRKTSFYRIAILFVILITQPVLTNWLARSWESGLHSELPKNSYDYGIVLGGLSAWHAEENHLQFNSSSDRLWQALRFKKMGIYKNLIFSGGAGSVINPSEKEANYISSFLSDMQIQDSSFFFENESRNTFENAHNSKQLLDSLGNKMPIIVFTSGFHARRAAACFKKQGLNCVVYACDRIDTKTDFSLSLFLPNIGAVQTWNVLIREWLGMAAYWFKGYI